MVVEKRQVDKICCCVLLTSRCGRFQTKERKGKESQKAKEKNYEDYAWKDLFEDAIKLKKLRVPELNKYLEHHGLDKHLKSTKNDKITVITRHWLLQMNPEVADLLQTGLRERDEAKNEPLQC